MANSPTGVRQDKTRRVIADLETTAGTFLFNPASPSGSEIEFRPVLIRVWPLLMAT